MLLDNRYWEKKSKGWTRSSHGSVPRGIWSILTLSLLVLSRSCSASFDSVVFQRVISTNTSTWHEETQEVRTPKSLRVTPVHLQSWRKYVRVKVCGRGCARACVRVCVLSTQYLRSHVALLCQRLRYIPLSTFIAIFTQYEISPGTWTDQELSPLPGAPVLSFLFLQKRKLVSPKAVRLQSLGSSF